MKTTGVKTKGTDYVRKLRSQRQLQFNDRYSKPEGPKVTLDGPVVRCCGGKRMRLASEYLCEYWAHYHFDCATCGAMLDIKIEFKERLGCSRCNGERCHTDDGHTGDDGGYLI